MRTGVITSIVIHLALLCAILVPHRQQTAHGETMIVDLVSPRDVPNLPPLPDSPPAAAPPPESSKPVPAQDKRESLTPGQQAPAAAGKAETKTAARSEPASGAAPPAGQAPMPPDAQTQAQMPQPQPNAPQPQPPAPAGSAEMPPDPSRLAALLHIDGAEPGFGSEAENKAKLSGEEIGAFKTHLRSCWTLPPGATADQHIKIVVRIALRPDGALDGKPMLIEAALSPLGPALVKNAVRAVEQCAPFKMLPAAKYQEWRVLDLNFSPDQMAGG